VPGTGAATGDIILGEAASLLQQFCSETAVKMCVCVCFAGEGGWYCALELVYEGEKLGV